MKGLQGLRNLLLVLAMSSASCDSVIPVGTAPEDIQDEGSSIVIVDRTGKAWDITTAVEKYGLDPHRFNFGLGPNAIRPINYPEMLEPEDDGYPADIDFFTVIGADIKGDTRAYSIVHLNSHEVVNEVIGGEKVFVGW